MSEEIQPTTFSTVTFFTTLISTCIILIAWKRITESVQAELFLLYSIDLVNFILLIFSIIFTFIELGIYLDLSPLFTFLDFMLSMSFESGLLLFSFILIGLGLILLFVAAIITSKMRENKLIPVIFIWSLFILCIGALCLCIIGFNEVKFNLNNVKNLQIVSYFYLDIQEAVSIFCKYLSLYILLGVAGSLPMNIGIFSLITLDILLVIVTIYLDRRYKSISSKNYKTTANDKPPQE